MDRVHFRIFATNVTTFHRAERVTKFQARDVTGRGISEIGSRWPGNDAVPRQE